MNSPETPSPNQEQATPTKRKLRLPTGKARGWINFGVIATITTFGVGAIVSYEQHAKPSTPWTLAHQTDTEMHFTRLTGEAKGSIRRAQLHSTFQDSIANEDHNVALMDVDCAQHRIRVILVQQTDRDGNILQMFRPNELEWKDSRNEPEPGVHAIYDSICSDPQSHAPAEAHPRELAAWLRAGATSNSETGNSEELAGVTTDVEADADTEDAEKKGAL